MSEQELPTQFFWQALLKTKDNCSYEILQEQIKLQAQHQVSKHMECCPNKTARYD